MYTTTLFKASPAMNKGGGCDVHILSHSVWDSFLVYSDFIKSGAKVRKYNEVFLRSGEKVSAGMVFSVKVG